MNDLVAGYRFSDLVERRIVSSRSDLHRKQRVHGFPLPIKISDRAAWWPASEVHAWLRSRAALRRSPMSAKGK
jgi:predicted DNA-binding transcriptional regulator AlpA